MGVCTHVSVLQREDLLQLRCLERTCFEITEGRIADRSLYNGHREIWLALMPFVESSQLHSQWPESNHHLGDCPGHFDLQVQASYFTCAHYSI